MDYDVLTFDTQTVRTNSFHFDGGLLAQLKQFGSQGADVIVSTVVVSEIARQLREATHEAKEAVDNAHKRAILFGLKAEADQAFAAPVDTNAVVRGRLEQYLADIGATIVKPDDVPMRDLVQAYFKASPPFAGSGKKKNEFPDAIALMSLERWAKANGKRILAVSGDKDWATFGEQSDVIDVVAELPEALAKLQEDADKAEALAQQLLASIRDGKSPELAGALEDRLKTAVEEMEVYTEADSSYSIESEEADLRFSSYDFSDPTGEEINLRVVQAGPKIIVANVDLQVTVDATGSFSLAVFDSVDRDYVSMGSTSAMKEAEEIEVTALVTFEGDFGSGEVEITKLELVGGAVSIDFGTIEPDYGEPEYEENWGQEQEHEEPMADHAEGTF